MDTTMREMTFCQESSSALRDYATSSGGMSTLIQDGAKKVVNGITSVEELLRVTSVM
jgi:type II secretory ATPase GspE/PulE/Tfp pilus assembly ATPase PilB-like protein